MTGDHPLIITAIGLIGMTLAANNHQFIQVFVTYKNKYSHKSISYNLLQFFSRCLVI